MNKIHTKSSSINREWLLFISIEILGKERQQQFTVFKLVTYTDKYEKHELQYLVSQV